LLVPATIFQFIKWWRHQFSIGEQSLYSNGMPSPRCLLSTMSISYTPTYVGRRHTETLLKGRVPLPYKTWKIKISKHDGMYPLHTCNSFYESMEHCKEKTIKIFYTRRGTSMRAMGWEGVFAHSIHFTSVAEPHNYGKAK
jgi:hypothetical protein